MVVILLSSACWLAAQEPAPGDLERQFRELPNSARRHTGPLFWLHGDESRARLELKLAKVAEGGNGTFTAESARIATGWARRGSATWPFA